MTEQPQHPVVPSWLAELVRNHPALLLTAAYIGLIFIGVIYEAFLFMRFRVNVLFYADAADFLLVPFREPLVMLVSVAPIPLWWLYMRSARAVVMRIPRLREKQLEYDKRSPNLTRAIGAVAVMLWSIAFSATYAKRVVRQIRTGKAKTVRVEPSAGAPIVGPLIGTTARFVFVFDRAALKTHVVPVENIARIVLDSPPRRSDLDQMTPEERRAATASAP